MKNQTSRRSFLGAAAGIAGLSALELESASAAIEPADAGTANSARKTSRIRRWAVPMDRNPRCLRTQDSNHRPWGSSPVLN